MRLIASVSKAITQSPQLIKGLGSEKPQCQRHVPGLPICGSVRETVRTASHLNTVQLASEKTVILIVSVTTYSYASPSGQVQGAWSELLADSKDDEPEDDEPEDDEHPQTGTP